MQHSEHSVETLFLKHYHEIQSLARALLAREHAGISTVTLVNELYLKLHDKDHLQFPTLGQFMMYVSSAMRRHLVDEARKRSAQKRSADLVPLTLGIEVSDGAPMPDKVLELDELLGGLGKDHPRLEQVAEMRAFALMSVSEIASVLGVSEPTVKRDWQMIKAYVTDALRNPQ